MEKSSRKPETSRRKKAAAMEERKRMKAVKNKEKAIDDSEERDELKLEVLCLQFGSMPLFGFEAMCLCVTLAFPVYYCIYYLICFVRTIQMMRGCNLSVNSNPNCGPDNTNMCDAAATLECCSEVSNQFLRKLIHRSTRRRNNGW
ncbi:hypothetical protein F2Q68_00006826 [Brassica cretica]|nr:hypothetical protein F2Q68_00006826 [Brassica cretica]